LRDAHHVPTSRHCMAEGVQSSVGIKCGAISRCEYDAGCADRGTDSPGGNNPHPGCTGGVVTSASDGGCASFQAGGGGTLSGDLSADVRRFVESGQESLVN